MIFDSTTNRRTFLKTMLIATAVPLIGGGGYAYTSSFIEVSRKRLVLPHFIGKLRIVAVSDVHAPCFYSSTADLVSIINAESPDIFILAGDTIDKRGNECFVEMFEGVKVRFAKIATLGNWEYLGKLDLGKLKTKYDNAGISLLVNDTFEVQDLMIVGLDDFVLGSPDYKILNDVSTAGRSILVISHCPESFDKLTSLSLENPLIVVAGHTHGGQIAPFGLVLVTPPGSGSYVHGWYRKGKHLMYVMRGIGTTPGIPLRIGARPEVLVLDLVGTEA